MKKLNNFIEKYRFMLLFFIVSSILIHLALFTKDILTADVLLNANYYDGYSWEVSLGRFGLYIFGLLKGFMVFKDLEIFLSIILFGISSVLLLDLFTIKNKVVQTLSLLVISSSPIVSATLLFHYCALPYSFAFLCGVLSIYLLANSQNKIIKYLLPIFLICTSLSLYQAYLAVPVTLIALYSIKRIFDNKFIWKDLLIPLLITLLGTIFYFILMKISLLIFQVDMSSYRGANSFSLSTIFDIPKRIIDCYLSFYQYYFSDKIVNNGNLSINIYNIFFLGIILISIILSAIKNKLSWKYNLLFTFLIICLPLCVNVISIILPDTSLQLLMSSGYLLFIIFFGYLISDNKILTILGCIILILIVRGYLIQDQATYQTLDNTYRKTYEVANDIKDEMIETNCRQLMIVGNLQENNLDISSLTYGFVSNYPLFWEEYSNLKNGWERFMKYYVGYSISFVNEEQYNQILNSSKFKKMKSYPNSMIVDNILVIKFAN